MRLYIVIPCYNEEAVIDETAKRLKDKLYRMRGSGIVDDNSRIVFVDDGSKDLTWEKIQHLHSDDSMIRGIKLSHNRGHQNALLAGLMTVRDECDAVISMDADLQDDIEVLDEFVNKYNEGCDIVYGVRSSRKKDSAFKRFTAHAFYSLMSKMGVEIVYDHADYRLMSKKALEALSEYREVNLFLRGMVPMLGFKTDTVEYERGERFAGESKYPVRKMAAFAIDGITSLSIKPIRLITSMGIIIFIVSIILMIHFIIGALQNKTVPGWATQVVSTWAIGGLQLLAIGVIGEYIGKIYLETKERPRYIVEEYLSDE